MLCNLFFKNIGVGKSSLLLRFAVIIIIKNKKSYTYLKFIKKITQDDSFNDSYVKT